MRGAVVICGPRDARVPILRPNALGSSTRIRRYRHQEYASPFATTDLGVEDAAPALQRTAHDFNHVANGRPIEVNQAVIADAAANQFE